MVTTAQVSKKLNIFTLTTTTTTTTNILILIIIIIIHLLRIAVTRATGFIYTKRKLEYTNARIKHMLKY